MRAHHNVGQGEAAARDVRCNALEHLALPYMRVEVCWCMHLKRVHLLETSKSSEWPSITTLSRNPFTHPTTSLMILLTFLLSAFAHVKATEWPAVDVLSTNTSSQIRHFSPLDNAVLGPLLSQESTFDPDTLEKGPEPEFHVFNEGMEEVLGQNARVRRVAHVDGFAFAHEAPVWIKATNQVFFASWALLSCSSDRAAADGHSSNAGGDLGYSGLNASNRGKLRLAE